MKKILNQQIEHLVKLEELAIISNDALDASNIELQSMAQDLSDISGKLTTIMSSSKEKDLKESSDEKKKEEKKKEDKSLEELKKISAALRAQHHIDVSDKALNDPVYHNMYTRMDLLKESFGKLKKTFKNNDTGKTTVGSTFKGMANNVASVFSKDARNRNEYITTERAAGNTLSDKELKEQYKEKQRLLYHNNKNERNMNENRGLLSKEEFLKADTPEAKKYQEEQQRIGERLSQIDSRYKFQKPEKEKEKDSDKPADITPRETEPEKETSTGFLEVVESLKATMEKLVDKINPLTSSNVSSDIETQLETARSTKLFQDEQLKSISDQTEILDKTLEIQKLILEELKKRTEEIIKKKEPPKKPDDTDKDVDIDIKPTRKTKKDRNNRRPIPTRNNGRRRRGLFGRLGLGAAVAAGAAEMSTDNNTPSLADVVPEERFPNRTPNTPRPTPEAPRTSTGGGLLDKAKGVFNKIPGASVLKNAGKMALRVAGPAAAALAAYEIGSASIDAYDESFGEGGKKVVQDLHHKKIISYNFGDSEVLDWKGIEELPTEDLKKLVNAKIRFKPEDDAKLHEVLTHKLVTGDKPATETAKTEGTKQPTETHTNVIPEVKPEVKSEIGNVYSEDVKKIYNDLKENNTFSITKNELLEDAIVQAKSKGLNVYSEVALDKAKPMAQQLDMKDIQSETKMIPEAVKPKTPAPEAANAVYDKSAELANNTSTASTVINNVTAPTNNVTQQSNTPVVKMDPRNRESTISRFFQNRNSFY